MPKTNGTGTWHTIDGRRHRLDNIAARLGIGVEAAARRIQVRKARFGTLSWEMLERKLAGQSLRTNHHAAKSPLLRELRRMLAKNGKTMVQFASKYDVSYMETLRKFSGIRKITPKDIELVCDFVMATDEEELKLHRLGAREEGWKV